MTNHKNKARRHKIKHFDGRYVFDKHKQVVRVCDMEVGEKYYSTSYAFDAVVTEYIRVDQSMMIVRDIVLTNIPQNEGATYAFTFPTRDYQRLDTEVFGVLSGGGSVEDYISFCELCGD